MYCINPDNSEPFEAYCDMASGGWTIFQRRIDDSVDFYRGWDDYVVGFGDLTGNLWAGLDHLHAMTSAYDTELMINFETFGGDTYEMIYSTFSIGDAASGYQLTVDGYSGSVGDMFRTNNGQEFSTYDRGNQYCTSYEKSAFWHASCTKFNPNGPYLLPTDAECSGSDKNIYHSSLRCLKSVTMKVRRIT